ncbi:hypothetical protein GCM10023178_15290 [Actinomadura luteofluorescens]
MLSVGKKPGRPRIWTRRQLIDGIRWRGGRPPEFDKDDYKQRHAVECGIGPALA